MLRLFGWGLIGLFGGGMLFITARVVFWSLTDYYVGAELSGAWMILGFFWLVAVIPIGIGVWMVRREKPNPTNIPASQ